MKVFIVHGADYEDQEVRAVYDNAKAAIAHIAAEKDEAYPDVLTWDEYEIKHEFKRKQELK
jgi:hypothetical protein